MSALLQSTSLFEAALSLVFPPVCQLCNETRTSAAEGYVCPDCYKRVRFVREPLCERCGLPFEGSLTGLFECSNCRDVELHFTSARSAVLAKDAVLEVIHRYKYNRALWFEPFLADLLIRAAREEVRKEDWDVIVPVPLHPTKQREREFNQAGRLARHLGRALDIPVQTRWLRRTTATRTQTLLSRTQRAENVRRAFAPTKGLKLNDERIVLIDDVLTTGATTNACAKALRDAGASQVCVWTVARGI
jgi:ComF family protein